MDIKYETMTKNDHKDIKRLITEAWFSDYTFKDFYIKLYASGYLNMYLAHADYKVVAKDGNKVVGFIFGNYKKPSFFVRLKAYLKLLLYMFIMLFSFPGRRGLRITLITNKVNNKLIKQYKKDLKNELVLFIVDESYQGNGIGSKLEKMFCEYLKERNVKNVYLYTDTYSNYKYYEKRNYKRLAEEKVDFKIKNETSFSKSKYYLYAKEL